jgi:hypothetical protein
MKAHIIAIRNLLSDSAHWTQGVLSADENGMRCEPTSPRARCWCLVGALTAEVPDPELRSQVRRVLRATPAFEAFKDDHPLPSLVKFNDEGNHAQVMQLLREAIDATSD